MCAFVRRFRRAYKRTRTGTHDSCLEKMLPNRFWWSLRFADFSFFSIWFSVFVKNTSGFSVLVPDVVFGFSYFVLFWVPVSVRFEQHLISNSRRLRVVPHFSSGIVARAKRERAWTSPHAKKGDTRRGERKNFFLSPPRVAFSRVGWFSRAFALCSLYYPWGKMGDYS